MTEHEREMERDEEPLLDDGEADAEEPEAEEPEAEEPEAEAVESQEEEVVDDLFLSPDEDDEDLEVLGFDEPLEEDELLAGEATVVDARLGEAEELRQELQERHEEVSELKGQVETLTREKGEINDRLLRAAADLENYRRRTEREKEELKKFGIDKVVSELLPAVDNMERALQHATGQAEDSSFVEGVEMVYRQILNALKKHGVEGFESRGDLFDPTRHEAIQQVESTTEATGTIVEQYQKGYFLHDRLLRPALVAVAKRVEGPDNEDSSPGPEQQDSSEDPGMEVADGEDVESTPSEPSVDEVSEADDEVAEESENDDKQD